MNKIIIITTPQNMKLIFILTKFIDFFYQFVDVFTHLAYYLSCYMINLNWSTSNNISERVLIFVLQQQHNLGVRNTHSACVQSSCPHFVLACVRLKCVWEDVPVLCDPMTVEFVCVTMSSYCWAVILMDWGKESVLTQICMIISK